jgi:5-methylcytosine-specific restriction endonuclease McrA
MPRKDPEERRAYQREYIKRTAERHRQHSKEAMARWRVNNPEKRLARERAYKKRHPDQHSIYLKQYRKAHPEIAKVIEARRRARKVAAGGRFTAKELRALIAKYEGRCAYCGVIAPLEADHRTPLSRGGSNSIDNILPACGPCNRKKGGRTEEEFRASRGDEDAA